jgi:pilus assembly protein CpaB
MRLFAFLVLVLGLTLASGAAYYVFAKVQAAEHRLGARADDPAPSIDLVKVAVARDHLKFGQPLTQEDVRLVDWPAAARPEGAFEALDALFQEGDDAEGRTVLRRMEPGEPILATKITGFGQKATVAALLDPGMRAHTIPVDAANSVGGFLLPGTRIDVLLTSRDGRDGPSTRMVLQDLEVIAVDQDTDPDRIEARVARTVTVQGTPDEVHRLTLAANLGTLSISLRGHGSDKIADPSPLDRGDLFGEETPVAAAAPEPEPAPVTVRVRRGNEVSIKTMD